MIAAILTLISGVYGEPLTEIPTTNMHSIGFVSVVLGRTELFTGHATVTVLPVFNRLASSGTEEPR